jgi:hypothetical protein
MSTLLMGHGGSDPGEKVPVPKGFTISFLVDDGNELPFYNGVGVVLDSEKLQQGGFTLDGPYGEGELVSNHVIESLNSTQRAWYAQVDPEDGTCFYAGESFDSGLALCTDPGPDSQCSEDAHTCGGIFAISWADPDLVWVSCRYTPGGAGVQTGIAGQESDYDTFMNDLWQKFTTLSDDDFGTFFDGLTPEQVAQAMSYKDIEGWSYRRQGRAFMNDPSTTDETWYAFVKGQDAPEYYLSDADMKQKYDYGKFMRDARDYLQSAGSEAFSVWFGGVDQAGQDMILKDDEMAQALAEGGSARQQGSSAAAATLTDEDLEAIAGVNRDNVKDLDDRESVSYVVGGFALLIGDGHDQAHVDYVNGQQDKAGGSVTVRKGGITSAGSLTFTGCPPAKQSVAQSAVERFSDKSVRFS